MKTIVTTLAVGSIVVIGGCNKTKTVATATTATTTLVSQTEPIEMDVRVEVDNGEIIVMVNGEERSIGDLSELMHDIDFGGGADSIEVHIAKMMVDEGSHPEGTRVYMMKMMGDEGDHPEGMREHMMNMMGGGHGEWNGEWREHNEDRDFPEEHQFMEELSMLDEVSSFMTTHSMAMLGIHMIRDELEPEERIEALERIISQTDEGSTSRNAALIVSIETLQELDRQEEAIDLMIELVVSN